jgi:putative glycosyltransferase (TIGR04348 family)
MKILIVTPAPPRSLKGNRITALRWSQILRELGHRAVIAQEFDNQSCDILVAIHARRSAASIARFQKSRPHDPLILNLSGTDLYGDIHNNASAQRSLELADRLILLQPDGIHQLSPQMQKKSRVIFQSMPAPKTQSQANRSQSPDSQFKVCVIGHLRPVKDPFRTAMAVRSLPEESRIHVNHLGAALSESMARRALLESARNSRYSWLGELPRGKMMQELRRSNLLALTSKSEGGANAISEAIVAGVPVISSRISGSIGLLGEDYPGFFEVGDTRGLAKLLEKTACDRLFLKQLEAWCRKLKWQFDPSLETAAWKSLLDELTVKE